MAERRDYTHATRAALIFLSGGTCYVPDCTNLLLAPGDDGDWVIQYEIAHISAFSPSGPRFDPGVVDKNSFANLILLCATHHKIVDPKRNLDKYPAALLQGWKRDRERDREAVLAGLKIFTAEGLKDLIVGAIQDRQKEMVIVLKRLEGHDARAAALVRELASEVQDLRGTIVEIDEQSLSNFYRGALTIEDHLDTLRNFALAVGRTVDLHDALDGFSLPVVERFATAASRVADHAELMRQFVNAVNRLQDYGGDLPFG
jgi:hypothetical protein